MKIIAYTRVSTSEQGESRNGLEAQQAAIARFCEQGSHELVALHEEVISGKFFMDDRPVLKRAFAQAEKTGAILLVAKLDRLSRSVEFISSLMNRARFATVEDGLECSPLQLHLKAAIAENERKMISERTKAALAAVKARGVKLGGRTSGHDKAMENASKAVKAEADAFAARLRPVIHRMRNAGMTVNAIATELNDHNFRTARGGKWHASSVCNIIRRLDGAVKRLPKAKTSQP